MQPDTTPGEIRMLQAACINYNSRLHPTLQYTYDVHMRTMEPQPFEPVRSTTDLVLQRMIADREARLAALRDKVDTLELALHEREMRLARLETYAATLDRLANHLIWNDGPRALRAVLPFARLLRRLTKG